MSFIFWLSIAANVGLGILLIIGKVRWYHAVERPTCPECPIVKPTAKLGVEPLPMWQEPIH